MKRSSVFFLVLTLAVFGVIQGWVLTEKFLPRDSVGALDASILGQTMTVGTPVSGLLLSINVTEGQHVEKGEPLFLVSPQSHLDPSGRAPVLIVAQNAGNVYGITSTVGSFVQASQILARVVDSSPAGLYIEATLPLRPEEFPDLALSQRATVQGKFLNSGEKIPAEVTSIGLYDGREETVDVRLKLLRDPKVTRAAPILGLPVDVRVMLK